jgi:predicted dehydrogenase
MNTIRWGILGTGKIAHLFAEDLALLPQAELAAVGSRTQDAADAFGDTFSVSRRHASYDALAVDEAVDVVYIATPHTAHAENTLRCLQAGRAVLCEKPFALNADEATEMVEAARSHGLFLMEAMWTRFLPIMRDVERLVDDGVIGPPQWLQADICAHFPFDPDHRVYDPKLGGGALLDLGVYPVMLAYLFFGAPDTMVTTAVMGRTGVDEQDAIIFQYDDGRQAVLAASMRTDGARLATLGGPDGQIQIHRPWWKGERLTLTHADKSTETMARPYEGNGYQFEAAHVMECLRAGRLESPVMPLDESLQIMQTLDAIRAQWALQYPSEA